jgi:hypothetical protein
MQMEKKTSRKLTIETIEYAAEMDPMERNGFIDLISDQYHIAKHSHTSRGRPKYPKREVKKFSDLLTKLVKKFGN